jgi:photosystem II stability/assembly factor-like uncharacterized protein
MRNALVIAVWFTVSALAFSADPKPKDPLEALKYRNIGPAAGGRVCRVCGVPGDPLIYYAAVAGGGVWKSSDGGLTWKAIFDDMPDSSVGSIAVSASDANVVYAGGGEANIRGNVAAGHGIYKSTDAGKTWKHVWKNLGQVGTMIVHPTNPDVAYAAVLGSPFGAGKDRGVYRTTDGGTTWKQVLGKNEDTGASDVCFDPTNPRILFAGLWQARRQPWELTTGGPGSGLYTSRDGGDTWTQLKPNENGLPKGPWGKIGVAVAAANSQRVFALIEADEGGLFRSDDGGAKWSRVCDARIIRQRAFYYTTMTIDPSNADVVWAPQVPLLRSIDGGANFSSVRGPHHGDHHDLWIDPKNTKRMINCNDGGVDITTDGGKTWYAPPLPIAQFYHVNIDSSVPYNVMGNMQDLGTARGPNLGLTGRLLMRDWISVGGGETGFSVADPSDPDVIYAGEYGGVFTRFDRKTGQARNVSAWPNNPSGITPAELKYRFQWTAPILVSTHDPKTIYHGANVVFRSTDAGQSWTKMSDDLTRNDKQKQQWSGGPITGDNTGVEIYGTVFALAESPKQKGVLWAGSDDGLVHCSKDAGSTWENVTKNVPGLPDWGTVRCIEPSPHDAGTAYLVVEAHRLNDFKPYLWRTTDFGKTWTSLSVKLPPDVYLHSVRCDTEKKNMLFVGTERGVNYSVDDGKTWKQLKSNLPTVAVNDLRIKGNDLVLATQGRSMWILDDFSPLRELSAKVNKEPVHLFAAQPVTRWRLGGGFSHDGVGSADNPPYGAILDYRLSKRPSKRMKLEILDDKGRVLLNAMSKTKKEENAKPEEPPDDEDDENEPDMELPAEPGLHRIVWNLRTKPPEIIPSAKVDSGNPKQGVLVPPGKYTIKLAVDGQTLTTEAVVNADPRSKAELIEQYELTMKVRDDVTKLSGVVQQLRVVRKQLDDRNELLTGDKKWDAFRKSSKELVGKLTALEEKLHNPKAKVVYDIFGPKGGAMLYSQLVFVYSALQEADGQPTQGMKDVYAEYAGQLSKLVGEFNTLTSGDLVKLNDEAKKLDLPTVFVPAVKSNKKPKP